MRKVTIYGERCSGTNYLEQLLIKNFDVEIVWDYGWKHFFGFHDLSGADNVLFIGIVRNLPDWINSLYREKHHLPASLTKNMESFLNDEFFSIHPDGRIHEHDVHLETRDIYKNVFELRHVKNKFLVETMPTLVKNYKLITYDRLTNDFANVMNELKECVLITKTEEFPVNIGYYKNDPTRPFIRQSIYTIPREVIIGKANMFYETILFGKS